MKRILSVLGTIPFLFHVSSFSQNVAISNSGAAPDASAMLDVQSTAKGLLVPRMTQSQRLGISAPAKGLLVFQTDGAAGFYYNAGEPAAPEWLLLSTTVSGWGIAGNANTDSASHFLGTTDNKPLMFRTNNQASGQLHPVSGNVFLGISAGRSNTLGAGNVALGRGTLTLNSTSSGLVAIGDSALHNTNVSLNNTAVGSKALYSNLYASGNSAIGSLSLFSNTTGIHNTAIGAFSMRMNIDGSYNVAIGRDALADNTSANRNTAIGWQSLWSNNGDQNTSTGAQSLRLNSTGIENTGNGYNSLPQNTTGSANTALGAYSMYANNTGAHNTALGYFTNVGAGNLNNSTAVGAFARVNCSNCLVLGSVAGVNSASATVNVGIGTSSPSERLEVVGKIKTTQLQVGSGMTISNIQTGNVVVGSSSTAFATVVVTFPSAFTSIPKVIATPRNQAGSDWPDTFSVTARIVTTTSVTFNIRRTDANVAWSQQLELDWIAIQ